MRSNPILNPQKFLDPAALISQAALEQGMSVADFGCGNGYYSVAAGQVVGQKGQIFAVDIMEEALSQTASLAKTLGLSNIATRHCDLEKLGACQIPATTCDLVILSSLLHQVEKKDEVLREAYRVLKTGGRLLVVEWKPEAPFGPITSQRMAKTELTGLLEKNSFRPIAELPAGSFHYALLYQK